MTINGILQKLEKVRKTQTGILALCPSHDDKKQSLSVKELDGKILLKCFAGCDVNRIVFDLGLEMKDLFEVSTVTNTPTKRIIAEYDYTDENGNFLFQSVRYAPKDFRQRRKGKNGDWIWNLQETRLVPYRLPEIISADLVFICEGEKDVEAIRQTGYTATCNPMGAGKWRDEYNGYFHGKTVVIVPDNDEAGRKHGLQVAESLYSIALEIVVLNLPDLPQKGDVFDFFDNGGTIDDVIGLLERVESWHPSETEEKEEIVETKIIKFPEPSEKCFYGLSGDFVRLCEPHTEADPMALLVQFLVYFGNVIGRTGFYKVEGDSHYTNLFCVLVGNTAQGRKGTSFGRVKQLFKGLDVYHEENCVVSGLASGEGLLWHIRDELKKRKGNEDFIEDSGISDKRLLICESEFVQVLRVQGREGNTLSSFIRNLWDSGTARSLTKNSPIKTTNAHVSIIGHITKTELILSLNEVETANGYANRFIFACVTRKKFLPFGSEIPSVELAKLQDRIQDAIEFSKEKEQINFSIEASKLWAKSYEKLEIGRFGFLAKVTQRASPYVLRLALIFALLDKSNVIEIEHLQAALSVWKYAEDSARFIFGERLENTTAEKILNALRENPAQGLARTEIRDLLERNRKKAEIDLALQYLLDANLARKEKQQTKGKAKEIWFAVNYDENDFNDSLSE